MTSFVILFTLAPQIECFPPFHSNRNELKYCTGGFHGSDNLFTNMQVRGRKDVFVCPPYIMFATIFCMKLKTKGSAKSH